MFRALWRAPLDDYLDALEAILPAADWKTAFVVALSAILSWWIYVPLHELAHAFGCLAGGGTVTRLEIDPIYGAALLQEVFPFVAVGSEYAGQLTGFDTGGSDVTYLATDFAPFLMTIFVGVPMLKRVPEVLSPRRAAMLLGAAVPVAFAPAISLPGDYYEMGSIVVSRILHGFASVPIERWRGDDIILLAHQLASADGTIVDALGVGLGFCLGMLLAALTYSAGRLVSTALHAGPDNLPE